MQTKWWKAVIFIGEANTYRVLVETEARVREMLELWREKLSAGLGNDVVTFEGRSDTYDQATEILSCRAEDITAMVIHPLTYAG